MKALFLKIWQKKWVRYSSYFMTGFIGLLLLIFISLQLYPVQKYIAQTLSQTLSDEKMQIKMSPITGLFPFDIRFDEFSIADKKGQWLQLKKAHFSWSFMALLTGEIQIKEITAEHLWIKRLPPSKEKEEKEEAFEIPTSLPDLDIQLLVLNIPHLDIKKIQLGKPVLGQALDLNLTANVQTSGQKIKAKLNLKRTDKTNLNFSFDTEVTLKPLAVKTNIQADETGGLLALLSGQPELKNLHLDLKAEGLLTDWKANLKSNIAGIGKINTQINLGIVEKPWLNLQADINLKKGLLPNNILKLLGSKQQLNLHVEASDSKTIQLKKLTFKNTLLAINSKAQVELSAQKMDAEVNIKLAKLAKLNAISGVNLSGSSFVKAHISGLFSEPLVKVNLELNQFKVNDLAIQKLRTQLQLTPLKTLKEGLFKIALQGKLNNLKQQGKALPESNLSWDLLANISDKQRVDLKKFQLDGKWSHVNLTGFFDSLKQQGDFKLGLKVDNLIAITDAANAKINTQAQIKIHPKIKKIDIGLNSSIQKLSGLDETVQQLLGQSINLKSNLEIIPDKSVNIKQLTLNAKAINLQAKTLLNLQNQQLKSQLELKIPHFKTKDINLNKVKVVANIKGSTENPEIDLVATLPELNLQQQKIKAIKLHVTAMDVIKNLHGKVGLFLNQNQQKISLNTDYALKKQQLSLKKLTLKMPKTNLNASLNVNLATTQIEGNFKARSDLLGLKPWLKQPLIGNLNLSGKLKPIKNKQAVQINAQLKKFQMDALKIETLKVDAKIDDVLNKPQINATLNLDNLTQQQTQLKFLTLNAKGFLDKLALQLNLRGKHQQSFAIKIDALVKRNKSQTQVELQKITGEAAKQKINLAKTTLLTLASKKITVSPLSLFIGKAHLQGKMDYAKQSMEGDLQLNLPLSLINQFAEIPVNGKIETQVNFSGTPLQPQIYLTVNAKNIKPKNEVLHKYPITNIQLKSQLNSEKLQANVSIKNVQFQQPITMQVQLPIKLQLEPFVWKLSEQAPLKGNLIASLKLEELVKNLSLEGQKISGNFNTNLQFLGTLNQPQLQGAITLKKGEYQNSLTETHFKNIMLQVDAQPKQIVLTNFSLKDTDKGDMKVTGALSLAKNLNYPFKAKVHFNHTQLANSPNLKTHLSGDLNLKGDTQHSLLTGLLNVDDFHFILASSNSQKDIPELEVIEIGGKRKSVKEQLKIKKSQAKAKSKFDLDIGIKIANQFYIKGYGLDTEWQGDLKVTGSATMPKVLGQIETKRGSLELLNNRFVFEKGLIDFNGAYPPLPSLDIKTVAETDSGKAIINIKGMADKPKLELAHEPTLPQDEVLSSLLFKQRKASISPMQALQLAEVLASFTVGGLESLDTVNSIQSGLGLDRLSIGGDTFDTSSVKAGKYVTDKIYIEVEQGVKSQSSTATVEIDLLPDVKAEVKFNREADSSVGIKWKHDY